MFKPFVDPLEFVQRKITELRDELRRELKIFLLEALVSVTSRGTAAIQEEIDALKNGGAK